MKTSDFDYYLPPELIAQSPIEPRDHARLMVLRRSNQTIEHSYFYKIGDYLKAGDLLVFNDTRVLRARLFGKTEGGGKIELLLLRQIDERTWQTTVRPGKKAKPGTKLLFENSTGHPVETAEIIGVGADGTRTVRFASGESPERLGMVPLPPYIKLPLADPERYQTVYARVKGSAAAPTAGLHFTPELLKSLQERGIRFAFVTLHIGLDTFRPVRVEDPQQHHIHKEWGVVSEETAGLLNEARKSGQRIVAVGTTSVRLLEATVREDGMFQPVSGWVDLFILPGYRFRAIDAMITNFHLPRSTLLMLVAAFAGREFILHAYQEAQRLGYRFYSFGDACLIL